MLVRCCFIRYASSAHAEDMGARLRRNACYIKFGSLWTNCAIRLCSGRYYVDVDLSIVQPSGARALSVSLSLSRSQECV